MCYPMRSFRSKMRCAILYHFLCIPNYILHGNVNCSHMHGKHERDFNVHER